MSSTLPLEAHGLTPAEAEARLARDGLNRLPAAEHKTSAAALLSVVKQPMVLLLLAALPFFIGLVVVLPALGHATWHLYRRIIVPVHPDR